MPKALGRWWLLHWETASGAMAGVITLDSFGSLELFREHSYAVIPQTLYPTKEDLPTVRREVPIWPKLPEENLLDIPTIKS